MNKEKCRNRNPSGKGEINKDEIEKLKHTSKGGWVIIVMDGMKRRRREKKTPPIKGER